MTVRASVVAPTCRRPALLGRCLAALDAQALPAADYEVLVCDDAASDETRRQVKAFAEKARAVVRYLPVKEKHGPAAARNVGWRAARSPVIAFTDDDTVPDAGWLAAGVAVLERDATIAAVTGRVVVPLPEWPTDYERNEAGLEGAEFVTANCFCRRAALEAVGGFDERFTAAWREDSDLHFALLERGERVVKAPDAAVVHPVRPAPWGVSLRQQKKSLFDALLYKKHPALYRRRVRPGRPWDYYAIVAALAAAAGALAAGRPLVAEAAGAVWLAPTLRFLARRLRGASRAPRHVAEMAVTSALIPPLSVFWRLYGAVRFRAWFF
jgi:glycosyltransferase involved in cell wall biosynthesis